MPIDSRLLEILRCPACRAPVRLLEADRGIECGGCRRIYPILDGIPVMLVEEAKVPAS